VHTQTANTRHGLPVVCRAGRRSVDRSVREGWERRTGDDEKPGVVPFWNLMRFPTGRPVAFRKEMLKEKEAKGRCGARASEKLWGPDD